MRTFKPFLFIMLLVLLAGCALISPLFNAASSEVVGLVRLNEAEIRAIIGLDKNVNMFVYDNWTVKKKLKVNHYVDTVTVEKDYVNKTIKVIIKERELSGYVQYPGGIYLYIDKNGYVLESSPYYTEKLPLVIGLKVEEFTVGKPLNADNDNSFQIVVTLAQLFNEYEMESDVVKVDVTDPSNIHLYINKVDVEFGSLGNASETDKKIRTLIAIMPNLPDINSILDIKDISKPARFRLLT